METFQRELCQKLGQEIPTLSVIEQKKQTHFVSLIEDYYDGIKTHLLEEHRILKKMEKQNRSIYAQRGELHEERRMALIEQKDKTDGFKKIADEMSCICNFVPVELPVDNTSDQVRDSRTVQTSPLFEQWSEDPFHRQCPLIIIIQKRVWKLKWMNVGRMMIKDCFILIFLI